RTCAAARYQHPRARVRSAVLLDCECRLLPRAPAWQPLLAQPIGVWKLNGVRWPLAWNHVQQLALTFFRIQFEPAAQAADWRADETQEGGRARDPTRRSSAREF